jgi:hypothetical protein
MPGAAQIGQRGTGYRGSEIGDNPDTDHRPRRIRRKGHAGGNN